MKIYITLFLLIPGICFAITDTYKCDYPKYSNENGIHKVSKKFELTFIIDRDSGKSYMVGNNGSTEMVLIESPGQLGFIEVTGTGNVMTTAIDSNLSSVHSRNSVLSGELIASQYYGKCTKN